MRSLLTLLVMPALMACAGHNGTQPVAQVTYTVPTAPAASSQGGELAQRRKPCVITASELQRQVNVRLRRGGSVVASLNHVSARLELGRGGSRVTLERDGIVFFTPHHPDELPIYPSGKLYLNGVVLPKPHRGLEWLAADGQLEKVRHVLDKSVGENPVSVTDSTECKSLSLVAAEYVADDPAALEAVALIGNAPLEVRGKPGGAVGLTIEKPRTPVACDLLERADGFLKIRWETKSEWIEGWVASARVGSAAGMARRVADEFSTMTGLGLRGSSHISWVTCSTDVDIWAEVDGERGVVGKIHSGVRFEPQPRDESGGGSLVPIDLWRNWQTPVSGRLSVAITDLHGCR